MGRKNMLLKMIFCRKIEINSNSINSVLSIKLKKMQTSCIKNIDEILKKEMKMIMVSRQKGIKLFQNAFSPVTAKLAMQKSNPLAKRPSLSKITRTQRRPR